MTSPTLDTPTYPASVQEDLDNGFFITDPDTGFQRARRHGDALVWTFKTGHEDYTVTLGDNVIPLGEVEADVVFVNLTDEQIQSAACSYYGSLDALKAECDNDEETVAFLLCEAHYELEYEGG